MIPWWWTDNWTNKWTIKWINKQNSLNLNFTCMWWNINRIFPEFKFPMYVMKHKQNILFLNILFGKTYIKSCSSHLSFSFTKKYLAIWRFLIAKWVNVTIIAKFSLVTWHSLLLNKSLAVWCSFIAKWAIAIWRSCIAKYSLAIWFSFIAKCVWAKQMYSLGISIV